MQTVNPVGLTIDGFLDRPDGALDFLTTPSTRTAIPGRRADFLASVDVVVMGRKTFDQVAAFVKDGVPWPYAGKPVYVVSRTMRQEDIPPETLAASSSRARAANKARKSPAAGRRRAGGGACASSRAKREKEIGSRPHPTYVDGGSIVRALLEEDLVDEMVLTTVRGPPRVGRRRF